MSGNRQRARILIVDDHPLVRRGLALLLEQQPDLEVCGEAGGVRAALEQLDAAAPDLLLVDLTLPDGNGLEVVRAATARPKPLPCLVLSMHDEADFAEPCLRAGARGYVMKEHADETVLTAIRRTLAGERWLSPAATRRVIENTFAAAAGPAALTEREREVFAALGRGGTSREIAEQLGVSERTVEAHRAHIKRKLGCPDGAALRRAAAAAAGGAGAVTP